MSADLERKFAAQIGLVKGQEPVDLSPLWARFPTVDATQKLGLCDPDSIQALREGLQALGVEKRIVELLTGNVAHIETIATLAQSRVVFGESK